MERHEKELIELLAPFINRAPSESKRRDMLYLKLHGGPSHFVTHSTFVKDFRQYGWKGYYIVYFALKDPVAFIRIFGSSLNFEQQEKLIQTASAMVGNRRIKVGPSLVQEGIDYYDSMSMQTKNHTLYQHIRKFAHYHNTFDSKVYVNKRSYTPIMIHDFYTRLYEKDPLVYRQKPEELFRLERLDYQDYLNSPFWYVIRSAVLYRDGYVCQLCGSRAQTVHHHSYDKSVLYGINLEGMVSLCDCCHEKVEFDDGHKVVGLAEKRQRYDNLRNEHLESDHL